MAQQINPSHPLSSISTKPNTLYPISLLDLVSYLPHSPKQKEILISFLNYRSDLKAKGFTDGFQWIDSSFVENTTKNRTEIPYHPKLVTFATRPDSHKSDKKFNLFIEKNESLFIPHLSKLKYQCDAYFMDLSINPKLIVHQTEYWLRLLSHQPETNLWHGLLQIDLNESEASALKYLKSSEQGV